MEWMWILWSVGLIISVCVAVPFIISRDLNDIYIGIGILLVVCPIINMLYPIYIIIRYIRPDFKKFL